MGPDNISHLQAADRDSVIVDSPPPSILTDFLLHSSPSKATRALTVSPCYHFWSIHYVKGESSWIAHMNPGLTHSGHNHHTICSVLATLLFWMHNFLKVPAVSQHQSDCKKRDFAVLVLLQRREQHQSPSYLSHLSIWVHFCLSASILKYPSLE